MAKFGDTYELTTTADTAALDDVADALRRNAEAVEDVGAAAERGGRKVDQSADSYDELDRRADDLRERMDEVREAAHDAAGGIGDAGDEAGRSGGFFAELGDKAKGALQTLSGFGGIGAVIGGGLTVGSMLTTGVNDVLAWDSAFNRLEAQTGRNAAQMEGLEQAAAGLFNAGWGESLDDITGALADATSIMGWRVDDSQLQGLTEDALVFQEVFDRDVTESLRTVDRMMSQFGMDGGAAFDLLTRTMQFTGDPAGDLLDTMNEYSSTFADMGFSADEAMALLISGLDAGAYNTDVVADGLREMNIRLQDGTSDLALLQLGLGGLNTQYKNGEVSGAEMFTAIRDGLLAVEDPLERQRLGVEIFGTKWEDLGDQVFLALDDYSDVTADAEDATEQLKTTMQDGLQPAWERFTRTLRTGLSGALAPYITRLLNGALPVLRQLGVLFTTVVVPALGDFFGWLYLAGDAALRLFDDLVGFDTLGDWLATALDLVSQFAGFLGQLSPESVLLLAGAFAVMAGPAAIGAVVSMLGNVVSLLTGAMAASPLLLLLGLVAAYETNFGGLKDAIDEVRGAFEQGDIAGMVQGVANAMLAIPQGIAQEVVDFGASVLGLEEIDIAAGLGAWEGVFDNLGIILSTLGDKASDGFTSVVEHVTGLGADVVNAAANLPNEIQSGLIDPFLNVAERVGRALLDENNYLSVRNRIGRLVDGVVDWLVDLGDRLYSGLVEPFFDAADSVWSALTGDEEGTLKAYLEQIPGKILEWLAGLLDVGTQLGKALLDGIIGAMKALPGQLIQLINDAIPNEIEIDAGFLGTAKIDLDDNPIPIPSMDQGGMGKAGQPYLIGQGAQPELFVPATDGMFYPAGTYGNESAGGGGMNFYGPVTVQGVQTDSELYERLMREKGRRAPATRAARAGGSW